MLRKVNSDLLEALQVKLDHVLGRGLEDHLQLHVLVQAIGILAVAPVRRAPAGLDVCHAVRSPAQNPEKRFRAHCPRTDLAIERLLDDATLACPVRLQTHDDVLKGQHERAAEPRNSRGRGPLQAILGAGPNFESSTDIIRSALPLKAPDPRIRNSLGDRNILMFQRFAGPVRSVLEFT